MGGLPVEKYPTYIFTYICSLSATWFFFSPLMSLDVNLFQLHPSPILPEPDYPLGVSRLSVPPLHFENSPFISTFHRPSASGVRAAVRYLHHALQSRPGIVLLLSVTGQQSWVSELRFWHSYIPNDKFVQRPFRHIQPAATMFE